MTTVLFDTIITGVGNCSTHVYASGEHYTCRVQNSSGNIWYRTQIRKRQHTKTMFNQNKKKNIKKMLKIDFCVETISPLKINTVPPYSMLRSCWTDIKYSLGLDFPNLPYYIDDDVKLTQVSSAI